MKIAISASGKKLEDQLDPRFGRCKFFLIIDSDDMSVEVIDNTSNALGKGAGVQSAQLIISGGAKAVITGNCGPKAMQLFSVAGVQVYAGQSGTIKDIVVSYKNGSMTPTTKATMPAHARMRGRIIAAGEVADSDRGRGAGKCMGSRKGSG